MFEQDLLSFERPTLGLDKVMRGVEGTASRTLGPHYKPLWFVNGGCFQGLSQKIRMSLPKTLQ